MTKTPERFHDTDRAFRIYKLSGLIIESCPGKPTVCILPDDRRVEMRDGEEYKAFLERCEELAGGRPKRYNSGP
ncbi:MAG: hypothetical protein F4X12_00780 [Acidobacteriia bacterium]|nr:hypothetical protein [Terriglobia bacterium]